MAKHHVHQHYVAKSYLDAWITPNCPEGHEPYVWIFPKNEGDARKRPPWKIFGENEIYTERIDIPGVGLLRSLRVEHGLKQLEDSFVRIRKDYLGRKKAMPDVVRMKLLAYVAAQHARTPSARDHFISQWKPALDMMDELADRMSNPTPAERASATRFGAVGRGEGPSLTHDEVRQLVKEPLPITIPAAVRNVTPILMRMRLAILCASDEPGFITSDNPCVWFDPAAHQRPLFRRSPGLGFRSIEVTMPLTPWHMLLVTHTGPEGYVAVGPGLVRELNRRTRAYAADGFVSRSDQADAYWYDMGTPPAEGSNQKIGAHTASTGRRG